MKSKIRDYAFSIGVTLVVALGGLLFGFNTSVIAGTILFIAKQFGLTTFQKELVVSTLLIGALLGAIVGGLLADRIGRKKTLFISVFLFVLGSVFLVMANTFFALL